MALRMVDAQERVDESVELDCAIQTVPEISNPRGTRLIYNGELCENVVLHNLNESTTLVIDSPCLGWKIY